VLVGATSSGQSDEMISECMLLRMDACEKGLLGIAIALILRYAVT
jgi:hypothetical protein